MSRTPYQHPAVPWYVTAYKLDDGGILLWDGEREVTVEHRRDLRAGLIELENMRRRAFSVPATDPSVEALKGRASA